MKNAPVQDTNEGAVDTADYTPKAKREALFLELAPKMIQPRPNTLASRLLALFKEGRALTSPEFQVITGSWRLSAVVFDLKGLNWPVQSVLIAAPSQSHPDRKISRYWLEGGAQ